MGETQAGTSGDRDGELRRFVEQRNAWRAHRRDIVVKIAALLGDSEEIVDLRASQDDEAPTVLIITERRLLVGRWTGVGPATLEEIDIDAVVGVELGAAVAGSLTITANTGQTELHRFSARDAREAASAISQRIKNRRIGATRRSERKPLTDLEMLESLRQSGVLSEPEFLRVRARLVQQLAVRGEAGSGDRTAANTPNDSVAAGRLDPG